MAVNIKITVFWNVMPCSLVGRWIGTNIFEQSAASVLAVFPSEDGGSRFLQIIGTCPLACRSQRRILNKEVYFVLNVHLHWLSGKNNQCCTGLHCTKRAGEKVEHFN
jgi:hypothetical protein